VLGAEDKVAIGTIRRYGLAADAMIMVGGAAGALGQDDKKEALRLLKLGRDSIGDILIICKSNGLI
jgi:hypothetical protein